MNVSDFNCYRKFLEHYLKENKLTYKKFINLSGKVLNTTDLSDTLKKGSSGKFVKVKPLKPEKLAIAFKNLKLTNEEISYLTLLCIENNANTYPGKNGSTGKKVIKDLLKKFESKFDLVAKSQHFSALNLSDLLDSIPLKHSTKLKNDIAKELRIVLGRYSDLDKSKLLKYVQTLENKHK